MYLNVKIKSWLLVIWLVEACVKDYDYFYEIIKVANWITRITKMLLFYFN